MRIFISESDRQNAKRITLMSLANFFNITNCDFTEIGASQIEQFYKCLTNLNTREANETVSLIKTYFNAYDEWFNFYKNAKDKEIASGKDYYFTTEEQITLSKLIKEREESLNALQKMFEELQLLKLNIKTFGKPLSGTIIQVKL